MPQVFEGNVAELFHQESGFSQLVIVAETAFNGHRRYSNERTDSKYSLRNSFESRGSMAKQGKAARLQVDLKLVSDDKNG
jgi:hypothetical protein